MKIKSASIENFKAIRRLEIPFEDGFGGLRDLTCLVGDNGSGKTTVLQAIALVLSLATRRTRFANEFDWHGFLAERVGTQGRTRVEIDVLLDDDEIRLTAELYRKWYHSLSPDWREAHKIVAPSAHRQVTLVYEQNHLYSPQGYAGINQFLGRYYVKALSKSEPDLRERFRELGDVFWFDQYRNLGSVAARRFDDTDRNDEPQEGRQTGVGQLRQYLVGWWGYHTSPNRAGGRDYIPELEKRFGSVFKGRRFVGLAPRDQGGSRASDDFYFLLQSEDRIYDLAEMSSGEQAVFPLVYEFVRLGISKSIVLIDELELHLHPPEQQRLLSALLKIGPDCQYIVTTHSSYLTDAIPNEQEVRLEGGTRCL
jgi:predicted ATPase